MRESGGGRTEQGRSAGERNGERRMPAQRNVGAALYARASYAHNREARIRKQCLQCAIPSLPHLCQLRLFFPRSTPPPNPPPRLSTPHAPSSPPKLRPLRRDPLDVLALEVAVLEREVGLDALAPAAFVVEVDVRALLVLVRRQLGVVVSLEPGQKVLVVPPRLLFELARGQVLVGGALLEVENEEQRVDRQLLEQGGVIEDGWGGGGEVGGGAIRVAGGVGLGPVGVGGVGEVVERRVEQL